MTPMMIGAAQAPECEAEVEEAQTVLLSGTRNQPGSQAHQYESTASLQGDADQTVEDDARGPKEGDWYERRLPDVVAQRTLPASAPGSCDQSWIGWRGVGVHARIVRQIPDESKQDPGHWCFLIYNSPRSASQRSASRAAMQPVPAAVMAWR